VVVVAEQLDSPTVVEEHCTLGYDRRLWEAVCDWRMIRIRTQIQRLTLVPGLSLGVGSRVSTCEIMWTSRHTTSLSLLVFKRRESESLPDMDESMLEKG